MQKEELSARILKNTWLGLKQPSELLQTHGQVVWLTALEVSFVLPTWKFSVIPRYKGRRGCQLLLVLQLQIY